MHISIPTPCHEDWNNMSPCEKGRHCTACKKDVVDFGNLPLHETIDLLSSSSNICGRIPSSRLAQLNMLLPLLAVGSTMMVTDAVAQQLPQQHQTKSTNNNIKFSVQISGTVTDSLTREPLMGVNVVVYSNN